MSGRSRFELDVERRADDIRRSFGADLRRICSDAGLSYAALARAAHVSPDTVARLVNGKRGASDETLARISLALGAALSVRLVPGAGIPIHDALQARMIEAFVADLHRTWLAHLEVPVRTPARGSIDLVLGGRDGLDLVAVEFQSDVRRAEQMIRWSNEKAAALLTTDLYRMAAAAAAEAGPPTVSRLLVLRSTVRTRTIVRELPLLFESGYPVAAAAAVAALRCGTRWPGSAVIWMQVRGRHAHLMDGAPRELRAHVSAGMSQERDRGRLGRCGPSLCRHPTSAPLSRWLAPPVRRMFVTAPGRRRPGATVRAVVAVVDLEPMAPEQPTDGEAAFSVAEATDHRL